MNRVVLAGLVAALAVGAEGAHAAKAKSCEDVFAKTNAGSKEKTIPVPNTQVRLAKTPEPKGRIAEIPANISTKVQGNMPVMDHLKEQIQTLQGFSDLVKPEANSIVLGEERSLWDFLTPDRSKNIAVNSPLTVMNAAQRMLSFIYSEGKESVRLQLTNEPIEVFPFFSSGRPLTNGFRLIGGEKAVSVFVTNLEAQAKGDRSASSLPLFVGSHGTGKSELLKLLGIAAEKLTSEVDPKFASYTFKWVGLGEIPELRPFLTARNIDGKIDYADVEAPLGDSPFTLFPTQVQDLILANAKSEAANMMDGMEPEPFRIADPYSTFFRNAIIQHFAKQNGRQATPQEVVALLAKHVVVKRQIIGQTYGRMPLINSQPDDLDIAGLFLSPNPVVRLASGAGPAHVMAWFYTGKIFASHGNALMWDEFFRNPKTLRDMTLGPFEERKLSVGGSPTVPLDAVMLAATNTANLAEIAAMPGGAAAVDRFKQAALRWSLFPNEVMKLLLAGKSSDLYQQELTDDMNAPVEKADLDKLVPRAQGSEKIRTSDYRYRLTVGRGPKSVFIAPHTILMMAEILAATRMELDPSKAAKEMGPRGGKFIGSNIHVNPIDRLRLYEGLKSVNSDEITHLVKASVLLKEGEAGISARHANRWFTDAIKAAQNKEAGYTLTPGIALKVLRGLLESVTEMSPSTAERLRWEGLIDEVVEGMLVPRLSSDISKSLANGDRVVREAYWDVLEEMSAISENENATTFKSVSNGQERVIDRARLEAIKKIYHKKNGRPLALAQITLFHTRQATVGHSDRSQDEGLNEAIAAYYADLNTRLAGLSSLAEYENTSIGSDEVIAVHGSLGEAMRKLGYNEVAARDALMFVHERQQQTEAPRR